MHRVELKVKGFFACQKGNSSVPNAPCGVESLHLPLYPTRLGMFLMHRVELKELVCP